MVFEWGRKITQEYVDLGHETSALCIRRQKSPAWQGTGKIGG